MKKYKRFLSVAVIITFCIMAVCFSASRHGNKNTYELRPEITIPGHKTDIVRIIDAYERLMDRYLDLTERNSLLIGEDIRTIAIRLDSIDDKLADLSMRIDGIESALGIKPSSSAATPGKAEAALPIDGSRLENPR